MRSTRPTLPRGSRQVATGFERSARKAPTDSRWSLRHGRDRDTLDEAQTRQQLIDPALHARGWTEELIRREETLGTVEIVDGRPRRATIGRTDYTLRIKVGENTQPVAVAALGAKSETKHPTYGLDQAKGSVARVGMTLGSGPTPERGVMRRIPAVVATRWGQMGPSFPPGWAPANPWPPPQVAGYRERVLCGSCRPRVRFGD